MLAEDKMSFSIRSKSNKGFTIVELLVALVMAAILTTAITRFFICQNRLSIVEEQVSFMQKNIRTAMEVVAHDVMSAGAGIPSGAGIQPLIVGDGALGSSDSLVIMANFDHRYTTLYQDESTDQQQNVLEATGFYVGGMMYIEDFDGGEFHTITSITEGTDKDEIYTSHPLSRPYYMDGTVVSPVARVSYKLSWDIPDHPVLTQTIEGTGTRVLADNIEDLQFSFVLVDGSETSAPDDMSQVRMVKILMTSRTDRVDCEFDGDGYRRRTLEEQVTPRNLDLSCYK